MKALAAIGRPLPKLYQSGTTYCEDPARIELWQPAELVAKTLLANCDSLSAYRAAELVNDGIPARALVERSNMGWHVRVQTPWGLECPSKKLGMDY